MTQATQTSQTTGKVAAEVIKRLVDGLAAKHAKLAEQRKIRRLPLNVPVSIYEKAGEQDTHREAWASDISIEGIDLLTNHELFTGRDVFVDFKPAIGQTCPVRVRLRRCERLMEGLYRSGGTFVMA